MLLRPSGGDKTLLCSDVTHFLPLITSVNYFNNAIHRIVQRYAIGKVVTEYQSPRMFPQFGTRRSRKIGAIPTRRVRRIIYAFDERAKTYPCPKVPGAYYEFTKPASRGKHWQSIGAVCCRVTSARSLAPCRIPEPGVSHPYISPGLRGHAAGPDSPQSPLLPMYCIA